MKDKNSDQNSRKKNRKKSGSAAHIDAIIQSPTDAARARRHTDTWSNQGTNISYEGATAPGGGGSVGTGQASGQDAVGARISSSDAYEHATAKGKKEDEEDQD